MQSNNILYYSYYLSCGIHTQNFQQLDFNSLINYNFFAQQPQIQYPQAVKKNSDQSQQTQLHVTVFNSITKAEFRSKVTKHSISNLKAMKEQVQFSNNKNLQKNKTQLNHQKEGRNANSNLLRIFFRRLQNKIERSPHQIQQVIQKYKMKITLQDFIDWIQINKVDHRKYIRLPSIQKFFVEQKFVRQHTKIMRILLKNFISCECLPCYLTSKKVRKEVMFHNYKTIRNILNQMLSIKNKNQD